MPVSVIQLANVPVSKWKNNILKEKKVGGGQASHRGDASLRDDRSQLRALAGRGKGMSSITCGLFQQKLCNRECRQDITHLSLTVLGRPCGD